MADDKREVRRVRIEVVPEFEPEEGDGEPYPAGMVPDPLERLRRELRKARGI